MKKRLSTREVADRSNTAVLSVLVLAVAMMVIAGILAGCGSGSGAVSVSRQRMHSGHTRYRSDLPMNPPEPTDSPSPSASYKIQLASNAPVSVGGDSGLAASASPETVSFTDVQAGVQMQSFYDMYDGQTVGLVETMTVQTTISGVTHTYVLNGARITSISTTLLQGSTTIPTLQVYAQSVQRTS